MSRSQRAWPHLLAVAADADVFAALIDAATADALRVGWLRWSPDVAPEPCIEPMSKDLQSAASLGVLRAAAIEAERTVAIKPRRGAPVLRDVLREHFRGCALVLIRSVRADQGLDGTDLGKSSSGSLIDDRAGVSISRLRLEGDGFEVIAADSTHRLTATELVARLRRARPW